MAERADECPGGGRIRKRGRRRSTRTGGRFRVTPGNGYSKRHSARSGSSSTPALFLADDQGVLRTLSRKADAGVRVRILMGDPDSEMVAQRGADEGIDAAMGARIRNGLVLLRPLRALAGVEMRLHGTVLYNSIYIADDQALVNCHIYGEPAANAPVLHLRKVPGGDMLATYAESFERVWDRHARRVTVVPRRIDFYDDPDAPGRDEHRALGQRRRHQRRRRDPADPPQRQRQLGCPRRRGRSG